MQSFITANAQVDLYYRRDCRRSCSNYRVSQKIPIPEFLWHFFPNTPNLACLLRVFVYAKVQILIQLYATLTKLCQIQRTTQFTSFSDNFPKQLGNLSPNFTRLLHIHIYARTQIFIQLSPTVMKLSATTQHAFRPMVDILS